jgi:hypothetical protein
VLLPTPAPVELGTPPLICFPFRRMETTRRIAVAYRSRLLNSSAYDAFWGTWLDQQGARLAGNFSTETSSLETVQAG